MNQLYKTGKMTDDQFWSWAAKIWQLQLTPQELIKLLIDGYQINPPVVNIVSQIRQNGYKALIYSNNFPARINNLQERFHFLDNFDTAVFSYEVGETKPSIKIFQTLIDSSQVKPEEIVFADDNPNNLTGAKTLGIQTFLYEGLDKFLEQLKQLGVKLG